MRIFTQENHLKYLFLCLAFTAVILACSLGSDAAQTPSPQQDVADQE